MAIDFETLSVIGRLNALAALSANPENFIPVEQAGQRADCILYDKALGTQFEDKDWGYPIVSTFRTTTEPNSAEPACYLTDDIPDLNGAYVVMNGPHSNHIPYMLLQFRAKAGAEDSPITTAVDVIIENGCWWVNA